MLRVVWAVLATLVALPTAGCIAPRSIELDLPRVGRETKALTQRELNEPGLDLGVRAGPYLEWHLEEPWWVFGPFWRRPRVEYQLLIAARDDKFKSESLKVIATGLKEPQYAVTKEFLSGTGEPYYWRVDGMVMGNDGETLGRIESARKGSFHVAPRPQIKVNVIFPKAPSSAPSGPDATTVTSLTVGEEPVTKDKPITLELGETQDVVLKATVRGERFEAVGHLVAIAANDTTASRDVEVPVKELNFATIERLARGATVEVHYRRGGDEVLKLVLGMHRE